VGDLEYTHPDVFTKGVEQGWADPETDPTRIDWPARQAVAFIPFAVVDGRPVNPCESTGIRYGRNELGHWGEKVAADTLVTVIAPDGTRWLLMVERDDGHGWAVPGGMVDEGETPAEAAIRELAEETGLDGRDWVWRLADPRYVPDPRASDEAWIVTVPTYCALGPLAMEDWPQPVGGDDAARAAWILADSFAHLRRYLADEYGGEVFDAHRPMLNELLG
jgi:ADP-ribose pyrophosphatase